MDCAPKIAGTQSLVAANTSDFTDSPACSISGGGGGANQLLRALHAERIAREHERGCTGVASSVDELKAGGGGTGVGSSVGPGDTPTIPTVASAYVFNPCE